MKNWIIHISFAFVKVDIWKLLPKNTIEVFMRYLKKEQNDRRRLQI